MLTQRFTLIYTSRFLIHLRIIERKYHPLIKATVEEQLSYEPDIRTRNRKPVNESILFDPTTWEIRFGPNNRFRIFYESNREHGVVNVLAIGEKEGNRLYIGGEEVEL